LRTHPVGCGVGFRISQLRPKVSATWRLSDWPRFVVVVVFLSIQHRQPFGLLLGFLHLALAIPSAAIPYPFFNHGSVIQHPSQLGFISAT